MGISSHNITDPPASPNRATAASFALPYLAPLPKLPPAAIANKDSQSSNFHYFVGLDATVLLTNGGGERKIHVLQADDTHIITTEGACLTVGVHFVCAWLTQG